MTNIVKILLEDKEELLACQVAAYYEFSLDDEVILYALTEVCFTFLQFIWVFEKNYLGQKYIYETETDQLIP